MPRPLHSARDLHIVGAGCYGTEYLEWLLKAREKGWLEFRRILAVDRNLSPKFFQENDSQALKEWGVFHVRRDWTDYLREYLENSKKDEASMQDHWVPSPLSAHLIFLAFLQTEAGRGWSPTSCVEDNLKIPVKIPLQDGNLALSFAEWICPIHCIEPARCPAIHQPRDWDMKVALRAHFAARGEASAHVMQCRHWVHGVGTIPFRDILEEFHAFQEASQNSKIRELFVATVSGCHGLVGKAER